MSVPRNPKLAAVFYRLRLIEAYGTGIRRMFEAYEGSGKTPVFDITRSFFRVRLPNRNYEGSDELGGESRLDVVAASAGMGAAGGAGSAGKELLNQERVVLAMLEEQGPLKRSEIQERFTFSQATLLRVIKRLESKGLVQAEGNTRRRVYRATGESAFGGHVTCGTAVAPDSRSAARGPAGAPEHRRHARGRGARIVKGLATRGTSRGLWYAWPAGFPCAAAAPNRALVATLRRRAACVVKSVYKRVRFGRRAANFGR